MFEGVYENAGIDSVTSYAQLDPEEIWQHYPTDEILRISAMKYATVVWAEQVKTDLEKQTTNIRHFIAGS
jgi:hypothetical protein